MFYIVPAADCRDDGFVIRFGAEEEETLYRLPLTDNALKPLQRLAKWLAIYGYTALTKELLVSEILHRLTLVSMEIAVIRFPVLGLSLPMTPDECVFRMREISRVQAQRPLDAGLFPVHFGMVLEQLTMRRRSLIAEKERAPPSWWGNTLTEAPIGDHLEITVCIGVHDHYCSGTDLAVVDWKERVMYLPLEDGVIEQLQEKDEWEAGHYRGARQIIQLRGWEEVV
jgi:hypothetical protein